MKFQKEKFVYSSGYLSYEGKFVARFKYTRSAGLTFQTFLIKNFEVEEYFSRLDAGEAPLPIAQSKGYILPHIKKWLKEGGYPVTQEGFKQFVADQVAARKAA